MTVSYWLGIDLGSTFTAAAICREVAGRASLPEVVPLSPRAAAVSSVVYLGEDGQVVVGEAAERRILTDPERVVREFKRRIGDEVPIVIGGKPWSAHQIAALVARWVIDLVAEREGGPATGIVITHPAGWGPYKTGLMSEALRAAGLPEFTFRTEPEAAAASYSSQERVEGGSTIAIYDFGGGTFDAAVVRKTGATTFSVLGIPQGIEQLGGVDFDQAVFDHVVAAVPDLGELDPEEPAVLAATAALRRECNLAKEALSADTEVTIPVLAPGIQSQVRLVRAEFEDVIRPQVAETVEALRRALRTAGVDPADLDAVLLVGGSSRVPLVAQLVSAELGRPVAVDADPKAAIALGAALSALPPALASAAEPDSAEPKPVESGPANVVIPGDAVVPAAASSTAGSAGFDSTAPVPVPRPAGITTSPGIEPDQPLWRRFGSRRSQLVAAGLLALVVAGGGTSAYFLTSRSSSSPPASAEVPAPPAVAAPAAPPAAPPAAEPDSGNGDKPKQGLANGPARPAPAVIRRLPASSAAPASANPPATSVPVTTALPTTTSSPIFPPKPTTTTNPPPTTTTPTKLPPTSTTSSSSPPSSTTARAAN